MVGRGNPISYVKQIYTRYTLKIDNCKESASCSLDLRCLTSQFRLVEFLIGHQNLRPLLERPITATSNPAAAAEQLVHSYIQPANTTKRDSAFWLCSKRLDTYITTFTTSVSHLVDRCVCVLRILLFFGDIGLSQSRPLLQTLLSLHTPFGPHCPTPHEKLTTHTHTLQQQLQFTLHV